MKSSYIHLFLTPAVVLSLFSTPALPISLQVHSNLYDVQTDSKQDHFSQNIARALNLLSEKKYDKAIILAGRITTQFPNKAIGYVLLGTAHDGLGNFKETEKLLLKAIEIEPSDVNAYARLGQFYYNRIENIVKAKEYLKKAISLNPNDYISHKILGFIYLDENDEKTAIEYIRKGLTSTENINEKLIIAQYYLGSERHDKAIEKCKNILEETPDDTATRLFLGRAYIVTKDYKQAIKEIKTAISNDQENYEAHILLSQAYAFIDDKTNVIRSLENAIFKQPKNPSGYVYLGNYYASEKSYKEALYQYREAEEIESKNTLIKNKIALMYTYLDQYDKAIEAFNQIRAIDGIIPENELFAVQCLLLQNKTSEAEKRCLKVLSKYPKNTLTLFMLSKIHSNNGEPELAEQYLKTIIDNAPGGSMEHEAYISLSNIYELKNDPNDLKVLLTEGLKRFPSSEQIRFGLGRVLLLEKNHDEAENLFKEGITILPRIAANHYGLGLVYLSKNDISSAEISLKKALELNPKHYKTLSAYTSTLWKQGKRDETFTLIKSSGETNPDTPELMILLARYYELDKNFTDAEDSLIQAKTTDPSSIFILNLLSDFYLRQGNYDKAMKNLKNITEINKDIPQTYSKMAQIYNKQGDFENELKFYQKSLSVDENQPMTLNNIAWHIATIKNDPKKAIPTIERAYSLAPKNPFILDTLGWIYYLTGDYIKSQEYTEQATEYAPNIPTFKYHLGKIYLKMGKIKDAVESLKESIELYGDKESEDKSDAIKTIESIRE